MSNKDKKRIRIITCLTVLIFILFVVINGVRLWNNRTVNNQIADEQLDDQMEKYDNLFPYDIEETYGSDYLYDSSNEFAYEKAFADWYYTGTSSNADFNRQMEEYGYIDYYDYYFDTEGNGIISYTPEDSFGRGRCSFEFSVTRDYGRTWKTIPYGIYSHGYLSDVHIHDSEVYMVTRPNTGWSMRPVMLYSDDFLDSFKEIDLFSIIPGLEDLRGYYAKIMSVDSVDSSVVIAFFTDDDEQIPEHRPQGDICFLIVQADHRLNRFKVLYKDKGLFDKIKEKREFEEYYVGEYYYSDKRANIS